MNKKVIGKLGSKDDSSLKLSSQGSKLLEKQCSKVTVMECEQVEYSTLVGEGAFGKVRKCYKEAEIIVPEYTLMDSEKLTNASSNNSKSPKKDKVTYAVKL